MANPADFLLVRGFERPFAWACRNISTPATIQS
jgi:hypothetical protein